MTTPAKSRTKTGATKRAAAPAREAQLEELLAGAPSPFSDAVLPNAFRETPDVPTIHAAARKQCLALIHGARETGRTSLQVVTGDAGEGKTHLIAWLRRQSEEGWRKGTATGRFALTVIPPLRSVARARHHVLQEVIRQLSVRLAGDIHVDEATDTPIEILLWRALLAIARVVVSQKSTPAELRTHLEEATNTNPDRFLSSCVEQLKHAWKLVGRSFVDAALRLPELAAVDREVFRIVARFPDGDEAERTAIVDWLGGASLSSERLEALGTSLVLDEEAEAARGLKTLLVLARFAATPVALAFDQIEGTVRLGNDAIAAFLETIAELYNDCPSTVLLVFCQTQFWPTLRGQAPLHVQDRLDDSPAVHLKALTSEEALLLVETRMKHFWEGFPDGPSDPLFPLSRERVLADVERAKLRSPRAVVRYFQALLREPPERRNAFVPPPQLPPKDVVRRKLDALLEEERHTARPPDTRAAVAQTVTQDVFQQALIAKRAIKGALVEEVATHRARKTSMEGVRLVLQRGGERKRVYLESSNSQHGKSAASTMKRLGDVLAGDQADVAVLLRDEAVPLPAAARKALVELTPRGAVLRLAEGEVAPLAALEALLNAAAAGDVPVDRKTALDIAVEHLEASLGIESRIVDAAFSTAAAATNAVVTNVPSAANVAMVSPPSLAPEELERIVHSILEHLRRERAFEPAAHLASTLGLTVEVVDGALHALSHRGLVDVVPDRNRASVVLLRPEALSS
jgi:hypothetical protein